MHSYLMFCIFCTNEAAAQMPMDTGEKVAHLLNRIAMAESVWDELVLSLSGEIVEYPMGRSFAWQYHSHQVLGEDVANTIDLLALSTDRAARVAGVVLMHIMPRGALMPVAQRLSEAECIEDFLLDDFTYAKTAQYLVIIAKRDPQVQQLLVDRYTRHSPHGAAWIRELLLPAGVAATASA